MNSIKGENEARARPAHESNGSAPLTNCVKAKMLTAASHVTKMLIKTDLSKFNVVNSVVKCENSLIVPLNRL